MKPGEKEVFREWLDEAREVYSESRDYARKMVAEMLEFRRKSRLAFPAEVKRFICKNCNSPLIPGRNLRIRTKNRHIIFLCTDCKHLFRLPYQKKTKKQEKVNK
ncbi:MAG TPA: hypothetical protein ENN46_03925 [Candidatus Woesearchaeota archaeon]|mgnify:CR=1 FL=1|nr:hypothetical protein [Candidatus Woesearchaeota archaeon]